MSTPSESDLIDIVSDEDVPVGVIERGEVHESGANFRVSHVFVLNSSDQLLLQELGTERTHQPFRWGSSVAAHVLAGESYEDAAKRRVREELLINIPLTDKFKIRVQEGTSIKFVTLFVGRSDVARIGEPKHSAALAFRDLDSVRAEMAANPATFTDTFRDLFESFCRA